MPQKNIWDFYSICKKKIDRQHLKKLNQNRNASTTNLTGSTNQLINSANRKSPIRKLNNDKLLLERLNEKLNEKLKNNDTSFLNDNNIRILNSPSKKLVDDSHIRNLSSPTKSAENDKVKILNSPSKSIETDNQFRILSSPSKRNQINFGKQAKLSIDSETRQIILKSKTIIDQTKSIIIKNPDYSTLKDEFIFKKPLSPAPRAKRRLNLDSLEQSFSDSKRPKNLQQQSILRWTQSTNDLNNLITTTQQTASSSTKNDDNLFKVPEVRIRKRLFNSNFNDDLKSKIINNSNDEFLNKLKTFQEKKSITNKFNVSFYSPSKRMEDKNDRRQQAKEIINCSPNKFNLSFYSPSKQNERRQKTNDQLINYSPKKFLENKLNKNLSPKIPIKLSSLSSDKNENQPPRSSYDQINLSNSLSISFNQSPLKNSPLKSSKLIEQNKLHKELNANNELYLPDSYVELSKIFSCLETVVAILYNRAETCVFEKLKSGIEKLTKKEFTHKYLAQIMTIYPNAYLLSYDRITIRDTNDSPCKSNKQQLIIKPNLITNKMTPFTIQIRTNEFKDRLLQFAKHKHNDYLLSLEEPIILNSFELVRWHPSFRFPIIPEAKLPEEPVNKSPTRSPVSKFWEARMQLNNMENNNLESSKKINLNSKNQDTPKLMCSIDIGNNKIKEGVLKGLSQSFLEKIKNKSSSANSAADRSPKKSSEIEKKINEIKKLPELIRRIHSVFTIEKKKTLKLSYIVDKLTENSLTNNCSELLIYKINELFPDWLLILKTSQGTFIKINMETVLQTLYDRLNKILTELENN